jgi:hypothetical protein
LVEGEEVKKNRSRRAAKHVTRTNPESTKNNGTSVVRIENGRVVEAWQNWNAAGLYTQLTRRPTLSFS